MPELSAIKARIGLRANGSAKYPDFGKLPVVVESGIDWSHYIDVHGLGWMYDKTSGHRDETPESPLGQQWGMLVVSEAFADQAVATFPEDCVRMTDAECEAFYDEKAALHLDDETLDTDTLQGLNAEWQLLDVLYQDGTSAVRLQLEPRRVKLRQKIEGALDPDSPERGVRENKDRRWRDRIARSGVTIKAPTA